MATLSEKYIAGFLDSDGSICVALTGGKVAINLSWSQKTSQDKVLHLIKDALPGGNLANFIINNESYSSYTLRRKDSETALNRIMQHLVIKRHYAGICLEANNTVVGDKDKMRAWFKEQRRIKSLPLPNFPTRKWLAGYFDGDGCISSSLIRGHGSATVVAHIACSDYDSAGIEIIHKNFGGNIHPMSNGRCKQWRLTMVPSKAKHFLEYFSKHLITKREQAEFVLGCAAMGHFRDGSSIKAALKQLKTHEHRLNDMAEDVTKLLATVQNLPQRKCTDNGQFARDSGGRIIGPSPKQ